MNKKILITGSGGFVGKNLYRLLKNDYDVFGVDQNENEFVNKAVDICDSNLITDVLDDFRPDEIVHLAALSNVEKCEVEKELANKLNIMAVKILADWANKNDKRVIFVSSDYVYDGVKGNFSENDIENPLQYYGQTKLEGEKIVAGLKKFIILRPTVIYGWDPNGMNFFMQLYRKQKEGKIMQVPVDQINNPTNVSDLCRLIKVMIENDLSGKYITTGDEQFSRYDFALNICDQMGWNKELIVPIETSLFGQIAKRPLNNSTRNNLVAKTFDFHFNTLNNNLEAIKRQVMDGE